MLGVGRDLCVSKKEEEEEDIVEHEREVVGHEILVMINVVLNSFDWGSLGCVHPLSHTL